MFSFEELFGLIDVGITVYEPIDDGNDFTIVYMNDSARELYKFSENQVVEKASSIHGSQAAMDAFINVFKTGKPEKVTLLLSSDDICRRWKEGYIYKLSSGHLVSRCNSVHEDKAKELMAEYERLTFRTILDTAPIGIWAQDINGKLQFVNKSFCTAVGIPEETFLSVEHYEVLYPEEIAQSCMKSDEIALQRKLPYISYEHIPFIDSKVHELMIVKTRITGDDGEVKGLVGLSLDMTEQLEAERELASINKNLEKRISEEIETSRQKDNMLYQQSKFASMGEMISNIAHQWRQPLNTLSLLLTNMNFKIMINEDEKNKNFEALQNQSNEILQYLSDTIDDFRFFYREDEDTHTFCMSEVDESMHKLVKNSMMGNQVNFKTRFEDVVLYGHQNTLKQVMINIYTNSISIIKERQVKNGYVKSRGFFENDEYVIEICDNGGGFEEDIENKIFEPYFTTKHKSQGTGLGLYMTKQIVETKFNGTITAHNDECGACFTIRFPYADDSCPVDKE